jgi:hypothetical protein
MLTLIALRTFEKAEDNLNHTRFLQKSRQLLPSRITTFKRLAEWFRPHW